MTTFTKRTYGSFGQFWDDVRFLRTNRAAVQAAMNGKTLSPPFRERIILAVTAVNQCRYCSYVHTRAALKSGVSREEVEGLFAGVFDAEPEEERVALLFAQHWAETRGNPDPEMTDRLKETYPPETVESIYAVMRMINLSNLFGNTVDRVLYALSFSLLGGDKK
ncbi:MAG: Carboxymuconolactone decarboxylase family protein [Candidatus Hydrogenedentes bacterium ADurb.Bin179]|nr:MAG: Carboxymuconolactone decarboxylase family protein [Candidatus Hydrogenedentes bacterium ADurb.Bin179]